MDKNTTNWHYDTEFRHSGLCIIPLKHYGYDRFQQENFYFRVKAESDAAFLFLPTDVVFPENGYYILQIDRRRDRYLDVLYRESKTANLQVLHRLTTGYLLDEFEFRPFWISLRNNRIQLGQGITQDNDALVTWEDSSFSITSVSIVPLDSAEGFWIFTIDDITLYGHYKQYIVEDSYILTVADLKRFNWTKSFTLSRVHPTGYFCACDERNTRANMSLIESMGTINKWQCTGECLKMRNCLGFNYNMVDQICELVRTEQYNAIERQADGWMFYRKCLQQSEGCLCD